MLINLIWELSFVATHDPSLFRQQTIFGCQLQLEASVYCIKWSLNTALADAPEPPSAPIKASGSRPMAVALEVDINLDFVSLSFILDSVIVVIVHLQF